MLRCLVTGAEGFVGSHLTRHLQRQGFFVRAWTRQGRHLPFSCDTVTGDIGSRDSPYDLAFDGVDTVFHLANTAHQKAGPACYQADCVTALEFAKLAAAAGVQRFVYVSSSKAVADPGNQVRDERCDLWPSDPYGYWKRMTEQRLLAEVDVAHLGILRPCLIYGTGVKGNLASMIRAIDRGYFPPLPVIYAQRSMVSVDDLATALEIAATNPAVDRTPLFVCDGAAYTATSIYCAILAVLGREPPVMRMPLWLLELAGHVGDLAEHFWPGCPVSSEVIMRLTRPNTFSAARLRQSGWNPMETLYSQLPDIVSHCLSTAKT